MLLPSAPLPPRTDPTAASAATRRPPSGKIRIQNQNTGGGNILRLLPPDSVTEHSIDTGHGKLAYTATAGTLAFFDQSGEKSADIFYTAYVKKDGGPNRPLTFVFNGGPGAASAFLHLGLAGPRILDLGPGGRDAAHAELRDNPDTWLTFTDLVFVDPIGTGWSRTAKPDDAKHFWSVDSDAGAMAKAIALYVDHNNRAAAPKYLFGESYGGFRAVKTARALRQDQGLSISGIVMLSPMIEGWLTFGDDDFGLARGAATAVARRRRTRAQKRVQPAGAGRGGKIRPHRLSDHARRTAAAGRSGPRFLRARGETHRHTRGHRHQDARLCRPRLREKRAFRRQQDRQPL